MRGPEPLPQPNAPLDGQLEPPADDVVITLPRGPERAADGLPARLIKPHTHEKFDRHRLYCSIFNGGMRHLWPHNRGYLELFAGSGLAIDREVEFEACPLLAAGCDPPFNRMAFLEFSPVLARALEQRLRARGFGPDVAQVFAGDANDPDVLAAAMSFLPSPGLNFAFIDPEDINGSWRAVQFLAARHPLQRIDFLINLPVGSMKRNVTRSPKAITIALGTDEWWPRVQAGEPLGLVIRETYQLQFERLGFLVAEHMEIRAEGSNTPVYDLVFASRAPRPIDFWQKIQKIDPHGQRQLELGI